MAKVFTVKTWKQLFDEEIKQDSKNINERTLLDCIENMSDEDILKVCTHSNIKIHRLSVLYIANMFDACKSVIDRINSIHPHTENYDLAINSLHYTSRVIGKDNPYILYYMYISYVDIDIIRLFQENIFKKCYMDNALFYHMAFPTDNSYDMFRMLIDNFYDINDDIYLPCGQLDHSVYNLTYPILFTAIVASNLNKIEDENIEMIRYLIDNGADINKQVNYITPLMLSSGMHNYTITKLLLDNGADPNIQNDIGLTAKKYFKDDELLTLANDNLKIPYLIRLHRKEGKHDDMHELYPPTKIGKISSYFKSKVKLFL